MLKMSFYFLFDFSAGRVIWYYRILDWLRSEFILLHSMVIIACLVFCVRKMIDNFLALLRNDVSSEFISLRRYFHECRDKSKGWFHFPHLTQNDAICSYIVKLIYSLKLQPVDSDLNVHHCCNIFRFNQYLIDVLMWQTVRTLGG